MKRRRKGKAVPESKLVAGAHYKYTAVIAGYPIHVFNCTEITGHLDKVGLYAFEPGEIYIKVPYGPPETQQDTLLHEIIHAVSDTILPQKLQLSEAQVSPLSTALMDTLRRNPELRKELLGEDLE